MDYSSVDSELIESLDFLRPPVKRNFKNINRGGATRLGVQDKSNCAFKSFCENISAATQQPLDKIRDAESTSSLILNKNSEKIVDRYSVLSYTNLIFSKKKEKTKSANLPLPNEKQVIKVKIFPKSTQALSVIRKRNETINRLQTTVSNQENSTRSKNIYLVVPTGRKKEKVYQIKSTGSAKFADSFTRSKDEVIPITQLSSLKLVLDSLNMERKKERNKKRRKKVDADAKAVRSREFCDCVCYQEGRGELVQEVSSRSCVRVAGRVGIDAQDRFVLQCAATVNDKPVIKDFNEIESSPRIGRREEQRFLNMCDEITCPTRCYDNGINYSYSQKRDSNIQTDLPNFITCMCVPGILDKRTNATFSKETQATQVDFNKELASDLAKITNMYPYKNEIVQCNCVTESKASPPDSDSDANSAKAAKNPLIIISVYPAPDCSEVLGNHQNDYNYLARKTIACNQNGKEYPHNDNWKTKENRNDNKAVRRLSRSPSPNRYQNKSFNRPNLTEPKTLRTRRPSPERDAMNSQQTRPNKDKNVNNNRTSLNKERSIRDRSPARNPLHAKGTNTDHSITKKIIVDNYTKKLTAYMNNSAENKVGSTRNDPSSGLVDDGDNEHYDDFFQQDNVTTDSKVKKTLKGVPRRQSDLKNIFPPIKRLLAKPEEPKRRSQICDEQINDDPPLESTFSRLQMRDSLEISHRHDAKNGKGGKNENCKNKDGSNRSDPSSATIKHYRGDNCSLTDPLKRDKEIRTLLGVDKGVQAAAIAKEPPRDKKNYAVPLHYFFNKPCEKKIVTGINFAQVPPCACCEINKNYPIDCDGCHKRPPCQRPKQTLTVPQPPICSTQPASVSKKTSEPKGQAKSVSNNTGTQYETPVQRTSLYQQLILNRNIQVFLQVEQFSKQRPIVLSRKQYDKVKRTIESTIANKSSRDNKRKRCICKTSLVSVGDVRKKTKADHYASEEPTGDGKVDKKDFGIIAKRSCSCSSCHEDMKPMHLQCIYPALKQSKQTMVLLSKEAIEPSAPTRQAVSSIELRYASMSYMKHVTFSSTNVEVGSTTAALQQKESHSIHTIFKGHKKCHTPNLGTSMYSLCTDELRNEPETPPQPEPKKKPFLRRLMSCLVMRSTRLSELNNAISPPPKLPSVESSIDSYHISTSFGAIEVTSSMYDTSASFYTNHSIYPINSKMKRGFFSSVREFLTNRKS